MSAVSQPVGLTKARIEALTDGVFAIAMTLMVFNIHVPQFAHSPDAHGLARSLGRLWPSFVTYAISFFVLGIYWVGHHNQFHFIRRTDRNFLWLNLLFLFSVTLIPFSAGLIGQYSDQPTAVTFYGANLIATGIFLYAIWKYATGHRRLVDSDLSDLVVRKASRRIIIAPCAFVLAIALGFINTQASLALYAAVTVYYFLPSGIDLHWGHGRKFEPPAT
ncbi:MAG TPA: TMEM175 family protein [Candidatus Acidoferrales bacterium]|nr:TMEM175 family protein [Candidatus Acidoferrales bacterium]